MYSKSQTLITGVYRTGTEYLTQLINTHREISATMYRVNVLRFIYNKYNPIEDEKNYTKALKELKERLQERYKLDIDINNIIEHIKLKKVKLTYGYLYDLIMSELYLDENKSHWAEKNQLLWREIPQFIQMMPNGKAILVIRDPRSVLASFKKYTYAEKPLYLQAIFNCYDAMNYALKYKKVINKNKFLIIKYEDLAASPISEVNKIFRFLDIATVKEININKFFDSYGDKWLANSSFHKNNNNKIFNINDSIHRWKKNLTTEEILMTELICHKQMLKFKYKTTSSSKDLNNISSMLNLFSANEDIISKVLNFLNEGIGIQEFPTNPLEKKNWSENKNTN
jgi:hypothetical protein